MNNPFTGVEQRADTTITITIDEVREINKKLLERKYLLNIVLEQDSVIKYQDNYIQEEKRIVRELQETINSKNFLHKQKVKQYKVLSCGLGVSLTISLLLFLFK